MKKEIRLSYIILIVAVVFLAMMLLTVFVLHKKPTLTEQLSDNIQQRFADSRLPLLVIVGKDTTRSDTLLTRFYRQRDFKPAWFNNKGPATIADSLLAAIHDADLEGLNPKEYHVVTLDSMLQKIRMDLKVKVPLDLDQLMNLEFMFTDAFLLYGNHLLSGRLNPETIDPEWLTTRPEADITSILSEALSSGYVQKTLMSLLPDLPCYSHLRQEMQFYKLVALKGGWNYVPSGPAMKKGDQGMRVAALSARLIASGDMEARSLAAIAVFDDTLEMAVKRFQNRHGMQVDSEVGAETIAALNLPALYYYRKIAVNMERWRWLPKDLGERYILVNIADYTLNVVENGQTVLSMPVVVGKDYRRTPVFSAKMTYLVLNPYWYVPETITFEDILPAVKKNPNYLVSRNIEVLRNWRDKTPIDPYKIDWSLITKENLTYKFRQAPGDQNALGRIKFMFPNEYDVYLHDTPQRSHFQRVQRAFSSGCIRLGDPLALAVYVLNDDPQWSEQAIVAGLDSLEDYTIRLPEPIDVHIFYCTAWIDDDGKVHFREDIYKRDDFVENALRTEMVLAD